MAIIAKVTFMFNQSSWGWSETFYYINSQAGLTNAKQAAMALLGERSALLSTPVNTVGVRVSDVQSPGSGGGPLNINANFNNSGLPGQEPWLAQLCTMQAVGSGTGYTYRREFLLRGLPLKWNGWPGTSPLDNNLVNGGFAAVQAFLTYLATPASLYGGNWCVNAINQDPAASPVKPLGAVTVVQPGSYFAFAGDGITTYAVGQKISISKAKGFGISGLIGTTHIQAAPAGGPYLTYARQCGPAQIPIVTKPGTVRADSSVSVPITSAYPERWAKRDTGRPFPITAGRQRSKKC